MTYLLNMFTTPFAKKFRLTAYSCTAFIEPENWPVSSLDLNPVYYSIMGRFTAACLPTAGWRH